MKSGDLEGSGFSDLGQDIRYAFRTLRRTPGFTVVAFLTLALSIGATTAMFTVMHAAMGRALPYHDPGGLVMGRATFGGNVNPWASFPDYMDYRDQAESLASLATIGGATAPAVATEQKNAGPIPPRLQIFRVTSTDRCSTNPANENGVWQAGETIEMDIEYVRDPFAQRFVIQGGGIAGLPCWADHNGVVDRDHAVRKPKSDGSTPSSRPSAITSSA